MPNNVTYKFNIDNSTAIQLSNFTTTLHHKNPPVKTLFSIGGAGADTSIFVGMASHPRSRQAFIHSSIEVARKFGFDGLDLDWEFPQNPKEMHDLGLLLDEWRLALEREAKATCQPPLLFTAAVYFSVDFFVADVYRKYPVGSINRNLDWINAMCFDYHGGWDNTTTGAHAALYDPKSNLSTSYGLKSWLRAGVPRSKLVMGLPLYGRSWKLKDPNSHEIGSPAVDVGPGDKGLMQFVQVGEFNRMNGATVVYDVESVSTYSFAAQRGLGMMMKFQPQSRLGLLKPLGFEGISFGP